MKLFKNRTVLGIFCIAVSLIICFAITPLVNAGLSKKVTIVRFNRQVNEGEEITRSMLDEVEVGNHNLPENVVRNIADVEGKYLTTTVYAGDYILTDKISDEPAAENKYLYSLNGEKQAMSITINTFAEGLSGKLKRYRIRHCTGLPWQWRNRNPCGTEIRGGYRGDCQVRL